MGKKTQVHLGKFFNEDHPKWGKVLVTKAACGSTTGKVATLFTSKVKFSDINCKECQAIRDAIKCESPL